MTSPVADFLAEAREQGGWGTSTQTAFLRSLSSHGYRIVAVPDGSGIEHGDRLEQVVWQHQRAYRVVPDDKPCPECGGEGGDPNDEGDYYHGHLEPGSRGPCPTCNGTGRVPDKKGE